jgi:Spy/CpxP family protein refolding chaperone
LTKPSALRRLLCTVFALAVAGAVSAQSIPGPPGAGQWWKSEPVSKELGLTHDQSMRIDHVFQSVRSQLEQDYDLLDKLEAKLSQLIAIDADETTVMKQVDKVETLRASLRKQRTLMLLHMRQILSAEQREKMNAMSDRYQKERQQSQQQQPGQRTAPPPQQPQPSSSPDPRRRP